MSSDEDSDAGPQQNQKRKHRPLNETSSSGSSSSGSPVIGSSSRIRSSKVGKNVIQDSSDSDSSGSLVQLQKRRKKIARVKSDSDSDSSGSPLIKQTKKLARIFSESEESDASDPGFEGSSSSQWESDFESDNETALKSTVSDAKPQPTPLESDSSDGESDKCPICLLTFKKQEIGTPEACDHIFCLHCIQEWSKTMNTCPVDRQEYNLILVRRHVDGRVVKQVPIEKPVPPSDLLDIVEDPTFCEICGSSDNEERMLLCDGCDLGFHLHCLTPALEEVPIGAWYCGFCRPVVHNEGLEDEVQMVYMTVAQEEYRRLEQNRNLFSRLIPRTRQTERLRNRIANSRQTVTINNLMEPSTSSGAEPSTAHQTVDRVSSTTGRRKRKRKKRKTKYRTVYKIDEATGETVAVKIKKKSRRKAAKKRKVTRRQRVKPQSNVRYMPRIQSDTSANVIGAQRQMAGIPTLDLFGQSQPLDYFSDDDVTEYGSGSLLTRRAPNRSDIAAHRTARRKAVLTLPSVVSSTTTDLLGSILDCQQKLFKKNSVLAVGRDGQLRIEDRNENYVNLNNQSGNNGWQQPMQYVNRNYGGPYPTSRPENSAYNNSNTSGNHSPPSSSSTQPEGGASSSAGDGGNPQDTPQDYSQRGNCNNEQNVKDTPRSNSPNSESEIDIYSDIETVSTSKNEDEVESKSPAPQILSNTATDEDNNDSEPDMVIDTDKAELDKSQETEDKDTAVTSTVDSSLEPKLSTSEAIASGSAEIQSEAIQSSSYACKREEHDKDLDDDLDSEDGCPNFSIYSKESINLAKNTDISLSADDETVQTQQNNQVGEVSSSPNIENDEEPQEIPEEKPAVENNDFNLGHWVESKNDSDEVVEEKFTYSTSTQPDTKPPSNQGLYSDSEDESIVKKDHKSFGISDIRNMTEDISEDERSYTPCLDEKAMGFREGLDGLETEMISDEERNDFDESHELKTASDGDALEINAKESELDFTRPEDYEEGEIIDKSKSGGGGKKPEVEKKKRSEEAPVTAASTPTTTTTPSTKVSKPSKKKDKSSNSDSVDKGGNKENENNKDSSFKKLSKSTKERNYRDRDHKEKDRSKSRDRKTDKGSTDKSYNKKDRRKEKRKEIERYDVRAVIAEKPRRQKDKFGRDIRRTASRSKSKSSVTPPRKSTSRTRRSPSKERPIRKARRARSRNRRSVSRSKSRTPERKRSRSKVKKRKRSLSRSEKRRKSRDRSKNKTKKARSRSKRRSRSGTPRRKREWNRRTSREWSPSISRSRTPEQRHASPSWTPPRVAENAPAVKAHNLTVILNNDSNNRKKKDKKKKAEKRSKEAAGVEARPKKRRHCDRTPPPSKEVFASGDNILVSVSFNKENETRDVTTRERRKRDAIQEEPAVATKKTKKDKRQKKPKKDLSTVKPVAIIDLERSPFKEITPSPKDIIVLSDSDNGESNDRSVQKGICDSSQQVASPERNSYAMGPKTPPEPQIKFLLPPKQTTLRAINNPLHEPDDLEHETDDVQEVEINQRLNDGYKGPNTPPEPPNSPPSSPDVYDPFEPTKSRSPTPEVNQTAQSNNNTLNSDDNREDSGLESRSEVMDKSTSLQSDVRKSLTPPVAEVQPADSQSSIHATPESSKSPERLAALINQIVQPLTANTSKPVAQTTPFSAVPTSIITSTPVSSNLSQSRINILNNSMITPPHVVSSIPQRIVLPNVVSNKSGPVKVSPTKAVVKSTPIKPMPSKNKLRKIGRNQNGNDDSNNLDLDSPYSPGSSDYEDLFEPPVENVVSGKTGKASNKSNNAKSPAKLQNTFDTLFGSPIFNKNKGKADKSNKFGKKITPSKGGTKQVGVKVDEDNLKILDELPNSAVEMQVKDKFLKKLNRQERVVEEVKLVLKPHYNKKRINKDEYKDILRRAVPKICHNKSGEINPTKIKNLIEAYIKKIRHSKKVTSSSSINPQKA